jgi:hypothetical protein
MCLNLVHVKAFDEFFIELVKLRAMKIKRRNWKKSTFHSDRAKGMQESLNNVSE